MIVVAIIGILSSIAVPNYIGLMARVRQIEAKMMLASVYTAEKTFQVDADSFTASLKSAGFSLEPNQKNFYGLGFSTLHSRADTCGPAANADCNASGWRRESNGTYTPMPAPGSELLGSLLNDLEGNIYFSANTRASETGAPIQCFAENPMAPCRLIQPTQVEPSTELDYSGVTRDTFTVTASGSISNSPLPDHWTIDETKSFSNMQSGI